MGTGIWGCQILGIPIKMWLQIYPDGLVDYEYNPAFLMMTTYYGDYYDTFVLMVFYSLSFQLNY